MGLQRGGPHAYPGDVCTPAPPPLTVSSSVRLLASPVAVRPAAGLLSVLLLGVALASPALAQPAARRALAATPVEAGAVRLDGVLDEPGWAEAPAQSDFVQYEPAPGEPTTERTEARVLLGPGALYVGMRMHDARPEAVDVRLARRDAAGLRDRAFVAVDSYGDRRTAFLFMVTPAGVRLDRLFYDDTQSDLSWDAVWDVAVARDAGGWTAEFEIPLSQLRYAGGAGPHAWGLQLGRVHHRTGEVSYWSPRRPTDDGYVSQFGTLTVPGALPAPRRFEAVPYVASAATRAPGDAADPFYAETDLAPRVGADVKVGLTSGLTLAATVNPDFGQVEADPAQVNLGGFELFFPEQRPFFVEGTDVFSMAPRRSISSGRPSLLYTRRIGRAPQRAAFVPAEVRDAAGEAGVVYTDAPRQSTILGAAKVSGRAGRFSVGLLTAATGAEYGRYLAHDGGGGLVGEGRALVEPLSAYTVGRARGTYGGTVVGGLLTSVVRDARDPAVGAALPATATVAGLDVEHPLGERWRLTAQAAGSAVTGTEAAIRDLQTAFPRVYQRPDANHVALDPTRTRLAGWTAEANLLKTEGDRWVGGLHAAATSPGFDANDLGFQPRADFANVDGTVGYRRTDPQGPFNAWGLYAAGGAGWNFGGDRLRTQVEAFATAQLRNFWSVSLGGDVSFRAVDDRLTRGGPAALADAGGDVYVSVSTDSRRAVTGSWSAFAFDNELGRHGLGTSFRVSAQPSDAVSVSLAPEVEVRGNPRQYVTAFGEPVAEATFGRRYVFGQLESSTASLEARLDWLFSPTLSLQLYARPFATRGRYTAFKAFDQPGAFRLPVYGEDVGTATQNADGSTTVDPGDGGASFTLDRDFTVRSLQGNAVLRWEYRPGSALFLVWQQQREGVEADGSLRFGRDLGGLFADPATNVFLVKLSYWLG